MESKFGQVGNDNVAQAENGGAGFDGVEKPIYDPSSYDDDGKPRRKGNSWTASAHIITAVIGSGILSLSWSFSQMGWIAGPLVLLAFALCTYYTSRLLADCYRSPDSETGKRNYIYMDAVKANLGKKQVLICGLTQYSNLVGTSIGYTIAAATSAAAIQRTDCYHTGETTCLASTTVYIAVFGVIQIFVSQIPNFGELWWLSYVAAIMSFTYSFLGLGLGIEKASHGGDGYGYGSVGGVPIGVASPTSPLSISRPLKVWNVLTALGNMAFAYSYSMILIEIQDTIRNPPSEVKQMKRATFIGVATTTCFYMAVAIAGYAAFGDNAPGNLLTGFTSPYWLVDFANTCVVIHLVGAYQVYTQPVYGVVELWATKRWPRSKFFNKEIDINIPGAPFRLNAFRLIWRTLYVIITTIISMLLPFFNDILGIIGAIAFWPLTVYYPIACYMNQKRVARGSRLYIGLHTLSVITLLVSIAGLIGSVATLILDTKHVKLFAKT